jgi:hypothetical protein
MGANDGRTSLAVPFGENVAQQQYFITKCRYFYNKITLREIWSASTDYLYRHCRRFAGPAV